MFGYDVKIPKERIAVLIGKNGEIKKYIEECTKTKLSIDSKEGEVFVEGEDALSLYTSRDIIRAIGRGFNPEFAYLLLKQDYSFELISLKDLVKPNHMERIKGRVIGRDGKARQLIENHTDTFISIYGKTISIIGRTENVVNAKRAIEMLINGSPHSNVYKWLEKITRSQRSEELL